MVGRHDSIVWVPSLVVIDGAVHVKDIIDARKDIVWKSWVKVDSSQVWKIFLIVLLISPLKNVYEAFPIEFLVCISGLRDGRLHGLAIFDEKSSFPIIEFHSTSFKV
jgi:hypothetical protein